MSWAFKAPIPIPFSSSFLVFLCFLIYLVYVWGTCNAIVGFTDKYLVQRGENLKLCPHFMFFFQFHYIPFIMCFCFRQRQCVFLKDIRNLISFPFYLLMRLWKRTMPSDMLSMFDFTGSIKKSPGNNRSWWAGAVC